MTWQQKGQRGNVFITALVILVVVASLGIAGFTVWRYRTTPTTAKPPVSNKSTVTCDNLALSKGTSEGTAGTTYWHAVITNNGTADCALIGYPAAFMIDSDDMTTAAVSNMLYAPTIVNLAASGGKAHVVIGVPSSANYSVGSCTAATTSKLRLYLPGVVAPVEMAFGESGCAGLSVTAIQNGA